MSRNLEMRCLSEGCEEGGPISSMRDWSSFIKHSRGHHPRLIDSDTGEILASTPNVVKKVLIDEGVLGEAEATTKHEQENLGDSQEEVPEETPSDDGKKDNQGDKQPRAMLESTNRFEVASDGETWFSVSMWLPSRAFDLFRLLTINKLSTHTDPISMLVDYAERGVIAEHNLGLTLAPVEVGDGDKGSDELMSMIYQVSQAVSNLSEEVQSMKAGAKEE